METNVVKSFHELGSEQWANEWPGGDAIVNEMDQAYVRNMGGMLGGLTKALATGDITGMGNATALLLENLDDRMTTVLFQEKQLVLWNMLERVVSRQPYYEWNERTRYGGGRRAPGFGEGGVPKNATAAWSRQGEYVKYMGVRRGITHQALLTGTLGGMQVSPAEEEERDGTLDLLALIERWFLHGNEDLKAAGGATVNYDGILRQMEAYQTAGRIDSRNMIDMAGEPIIFDNIEDAALTLLTVGKLPTTENVKFLMHPKVSAGLSLQKQPSERVTVPTGIAGGDRSFGVPTNGYNSNQGHIPFFPSIFTDEVEDDKVLTVAGDVEPTAPDAPGTLSSTASSDSGADWANTYYYFASAVNDGGESLGLVDDGGAQVVAVDEKVTLTIGRVSAAYAYRIYRGLLVTGLDAKILGTIAQPSSGDATFVDQNARMPGTHFAVMFNNSRPDLTVAQMAPLIKFPLGLTSTTIEFLLLLYHTLVVKAPERVVVFKNVGDYISAA